MTNFISITETSLTNIAPSMVTNIDGSISVIQKVSRTTVAIGPLFVPCMMILVGLLVGVIWGWLRSRRAEAEEGKR